MNWARILACNTGPVDQELLLHQDFDPDADALVPPLLLFERN